MVRMKKRAKLKPTDETRNQKHAAKTETVSNQTNKQKQKQTKINEKINLLFTQNVFLKEVQDFC